MKYARTVGDIKDAKERSTGNFSLVEGLMLCTYNLAILCVSETPPIMEIGVYHVTAQV